MPSRRVEPFVIEIPERQLRDLAARLANTRWPDAVEGAGWAYGIDADYLRAAVGHWGTAYDWRAEERRLNGFRHFRATLGDATVGHCRVHFIHERGRGPSPLPLVVTHGWPGSFVELLDLVPRLTDPAAYGGDPRDAFDVVVPSLPGFGFSERPTRAGANLHRTAALWEELMTALGYTRFGAQGGDFGAGVCTALGLRDAGRLVGIHLNYIPGSYLPPDLSDLSPEEGAFRADAAAWYAAAGGYARVQRTTPQTVAVALNDSPAGLAAWILEKFWLWMDPAHREDGVGGVRLDTLLTNVMVYWLTETAPSAARLYHEVARRPLHFAPGERVRVPCGVARFAHEAPFPPRRWVERGYHVTRWQEIPCGGHFAALEEPERLAEDIHAFFRPLR